MGGPVRGAALTPAEPAPAAEAEELVPPREDTGGAGEGTGSDPGSGWPFGYSTVTLFARFRGMSTSLPR